MTSSLSQRFPGPEVGCAARVHLPWVFPEAEGGDRVAGRQGPHRALEQKEHGRFTVGCGAVSVSGWNERMKVIVRYFRCFATIVL